jgi:hypothetical protein
VNEGTDKYDGFYYRGKRLLNGTVKSNKIKRGGIINVGKRLRGGSSLSQVFIKFPLALKNNLSSIVLSVDLTERILVSEL